MHAMVLLCMHALIRILASLNTFLDNVDLKTDNQSSLGTNRTTFSYKTFALQVEDINPKTFAGQTFTVALGTVEQARNASDGINSRALITEDGVVGSRRKRRNSDSNTGEATATLRLHPELFEHCFNSSLNTSSPQNVRQRLSYSVFLSDALFLPANRTSNMVGSIVVGARAICQHANNTVLSEHTNETRLTQSSFQTIETVRLQGKLLTFTNL